MLDLAAHGHCPSFLLQRMPNNKPKGSPSRSPKRAATPAHCQPTQLAHIAMHTTMPAHCLPTSSVMPSLFPANMRSNACVLQANTRSNALPISNQHAQHQWMPPTNQPARQCLLGKARQCLLGNCVPWLTICLENVCHCRENMGHCREIWCHCRENWCHGREIWAMANHYCRVTRATMPFHCRPTRPKCQPMRAAMLANCLPTRAAMPSLDPCWVRGGLGIHPPLYMLYELFSECQEETLPMLEES